ncbi:MAG: bifunctional 2-polyprenyl-6-hydroxyphenol methylase/3-demethylubiquinol 3-O-methyltransferase UbiG [Proteobacteria bacterium]|nr:MAG: bifunctional 2-polyprenyl-6-hydroxyphenol methylase/3-demethylubiquinol 3-O-methyltransferase UbiG [Pseudomonadota bacterium]
MNAASNVDPREIEKFESLASRWWDPESEFKPLHDMNPVRLDYIEKEAVLKDKTVVDVGCGGGILSEAMAARGARVTGIDMGATPLAVARLHAVESGVDVEYRKCRAEDIADERPGEFDVVTCMEMLEHVPDPARVVDACARLVKPGGHVFFATINRTPKAWLMAIVGAEYVLNLLPRGTHRFQNLIRPSELSAWCREAGLGVSEVTGMHYNPITRAFWIAPGVGVNYIVYSRP